MTAALLVTLLGAEPAEHLERGLKLLEASDPAAAHAELVQAFTLDPELPAPALPAVEAARAQAVAALKAGLAAAAEKATAAFTAPLPQADASLDPPKPVEPAPPAPQLEQRPPEKERPLVLGGRLSAGAYGFYVIGESRGGPALELSFGVNLGSLRVGGVAAFLVGSSLGLTVAARVSTTSESRVAYLAAADLGVFYGGSNALFAPFLTAHAAGVRLKLGRVALELHIASLSLFWLGGSSFRFVPQSGIAVLL